MKTQSKRDDEKRVARQKMDKRAQARFQNIQFLEEHDLELLGDDDDHQDDEQVLNQVNEESDDEDRAPRYQLLPSTSPRYEAIVQHSPLGVPLDDTCLESDQSSSTTLASSTSTSRSSSIIVADSQEPQDFAISPLMPSEIDSAPGSPSNPRRAASQLKCPACGQPMRIYYCVKCIQRGRFVALDTEGRFHETNMVEEEEREECECQEPAPTSEPLTESFNSQTNDTADQQQSQLDHMLQVKYRNLVKKTEALKNLFQGQQEKLTQTLNFLEETKAQLDFNRRSNRSTESKIELIKKIITSRKASIEKRRAAQANLSEDFRQYVHRRAFQLTNDVFPLDEINLFERSNSFVNMETSPLLTFSDGSHHQIEQQTAYSIVEPWLPSDGDYSSYSLWVNDNREHLAATISDSSERNPAFRIGAALAYTSQLTQNLASYLDMILPARLDLGVFNRELLDDTQFSYNVAKLNTNIIHLCITQGVDICLLHPHRTLKNLMLLFNINIADLGRKPIIEVDNEEAALKIEEKLSVDLGLVQDSFYDFSKFAADDDNSDSEWEISDSINTPDMAMTSEQSIQQNSYMSRLPLRLLSSFWGTGS